MKQMRIHSLTFFKILHMQNENMSNFKSFERNTFKCHCFNIQPTFLCKQNDLMT